MSSTCRSNARDSHVADYYVTPLNAINDFIEATKKHKPEILSNIDSKIVLDPCAGGDAANDMSYPVCLRSAGVKKLITIDIREDSLADIKKDYLAINAKDKFDIIITNPPFNIALDIIKKSLDDVKEGGLVIMLLRLNFYGSEKRRPFFEKNMPNWAFVHSKRIGFVPGDKSKTDSIEYMHAVWKKGLYTKSTELFLI